MIMSDFFLSIFYYLRWSINEVKRVMFHERGGYMFINHTNHLSQYWSDTQLDAGRQYGVIMDMPFPRIDPMASSADISQLAQEYAARIIALHPTAVICQGEFIYCHALVERLLAVGITVVAATSERVVEESYGDGVNEKIVNFQFVQFREYCR